MDSATGAPGVSHLVALQASAGNRAVSQLPVVQRYRPKGSFAFGEMDTADLKEDSFDRSRDRTRKPWIELITVDFHQVSADADGLAMPVGVAAARYHDGRLPPVGMYVTGGSRELGLTTAGGPRTVTRIEGVGYNDAVSAAVLDPSQREGPGRRYTRRDPTGDRSATMSLAVFFHRGEALHIGPLDQSSHGCVHLGDAWDGARRFNYHSVVGLTKVVVTYSGIEDALRKGTAQPDPKIDTNRWARLRTGHYAQHVALQAAFRNSPPLRPGARGAAVAAVQEGLVAALGRPMPASTRPNGELDGSYGRETSNAVREFQRRLSQVTGVVGRETLGALDALGAPPGR